ncbi:hypothetical protein A2291_04765 [candidate division WOR-1 bacterium RIFOXYB2_FULL_42_35]|uniref:Uncharacterized protein n=1 Tax=candidate division WOR-1 bacterium RIFOXYC2_FULL_41_25 TaxID=1802586 RepID=A0A1F4TN77_UNCSA|nr:MAG: hypothetical protein A2247_06965 [candidate division WOR-1 bacterium RIFOXYA2_FULL_41_14]OGC24643.1 MAG: hypothetical protein A2291_04765 [candidate division WOR-1 bacterium RIFOXYB2_FULL_42_35]OGC34158.1 MAG: hypothetical protein A2462_08010 [candidate division WOR-1 bacterium RIFOXYC2_FULL_41_25]OGC42278.1 MAG: hypothetical protein A2548_04575 [candidate division WOR-1 bacterium RIFOXYD2_FULL_41_8]
MKIITQPITISTLNDMAKNMFGNMIKAVVDVERQIMAVDAELHSDEEALLLQDGSKNQDLWGINLYPDLEGDDWIEFDSMINLRPAQNNRTRGVEDSQIREKIVQIVSKLVQK